MCVCAWGIAVPSAAIRACCFRSCVSYLGALVSARKKSFPFLGQAPPAVGKVRLKRGRNHKSWWVWAEKEVNEKGPYFAPARLGARRTVTRS